MSPPRNVAITLGGIAKPTASPRSRETTTPTSRPLGSTTGPPEFPSIIEPANWTLASLLFSSRRRLLIVIELTVTAGFDLMFPATCWIIPPSGNPSA